MGYVRLQREPFSLDRVLADLRAPATGGVNLYVGTVRSDDDGRRVEALDVEAFAEMAMEQLERLRQDTIERFDLADAIVIHRLGRIAAGDPILVVALAAKHRKETFRAVDHFMDRLKERIPIWKREDGAEGRTWILGAQRHGGAR